MDDLKGINSIIRSALDGFFIKDYDRALNELKAAEVIDRDNPEILYNIAVAYCRMGLYNSALDYLKRILTLKLTFIESGQVKKLMAFALINMEKYKAALRVIKDAERGEMKDIQLLSMAGYCYEKTDRPDLALDLHRRVIALDKYNLNAINSCAYIMAMLGTDIDGALKLALFACEKEKGNGAYFDTLGYIMLKIGKLEKAEAYLKKAEQILPFSNEIKKHIEELNSAKKKL